MSDFKRALQFVLEHECVFAKHHYGDMAFVVSENEANDPGGLTKFGIDKASHPDVDVENLTLEQSSEIYRKEYWDKFHCEELAWPLNAVHFDNCVNMGARQAIKLLQRAAGAHDDGVWGPSTKAYTMAACKVRGTAAVALNVIEAKQYFYEKLAEQKPQLARFKQGWLNRTLDLQKAIV
jgi:lysozyme family protein